ncbi:zinc ribbon domain-containing protein [Cohnella kolymensis]|uniref:zinc ribbon domain-containing protein n=1 Tax=Cohnella kolymensis TaxID=1590652 RepID=UPI0006966555|nr:zinc ribbon domain-containing protein [Cohnella kolymensis]
MSFLKKITDSVSKGVSSATEKAQQTVEITRINSQISGKRKEIERLYADIGEAVYSAYRAHDLSLAEAKVIPLCEEVAAIHEEINALDDRIKELRNEKDCVCGERVTYDVRFCPSCGHQFPEPAQIRTEEAPPASEEPAVAPAADAIGMEPPAEAADAIHAADLYTEETEELPSRHQRPQLCHNCGSRLEADSRFCQTCGKAAYQ